MKLRTVDGLTFPQWEARADAYINEVAGLSMDCLGDSNTYEAWQNGVAPEEHAQEHLEESGYPQ